MPTNKSVSQKGLPGMQAAVQPITGPASMDAAAMALSPEEMALVAQGIDPFGEGTMAPAGMPSPAAGGMDPQTRAALGSALQQILASMPAPSSDADQAVVMGLEQAMMALQAGSGGGF